MNNNNNIINDDILNHLKLSQRNEYTYLIEIINKLHQTTNNVNQQDNQYTNIEDDENINSPFEIFKKEVMKEFQNIYNINNQLKLENKILFQTISILSFNFDKLSTKANQDILNFEKSIEQLKTYIESVKERYINISKPTKLKEFEDFVGTNPSVIAGIYKFNREKVTASQCDSYFLNTAKMYYFYQMKEHVQPFVDYVTQLINKDTFDKQQQFKQSFQHLGGGHILKMQLEDLNKTGESIINQVKRDLLNINSSFYLNLSSIDQILLRKELSDYFIDLRKSLKSFFNNQENNQLFSINLLNNQSNLIQNLKNQLLKLPKKLKCITKNISNYNDEQIKEIYSIFYNYKNINNQQMKQSQIQHIILPLQEQPQIPLTTLTSQDQFDIEFSENDDSDSCNELVSTSQLHNEQNFDDFSSIIESRSKIIEANIKHDIERLFKNSTSSELSQISNKMYDINDDIENDPYSPEIDKLIPHEK